MAKTIVQPTQDQAQMSDAEFYNFIRTRVLRNTKGMTAPKLVFQMIGELDSGTTLNGACNMLDHLIAVASETKLYLQKTKHFS